MDISSAGAVDAAASEAVGAAAPFERFGVRHFAGVRAKQEIKDAGSGQETRSRPTCYQRVR